MYKIRKRFCYILRIFCLLYSVLFFQAYDALAEESITEQPYNLAVEIANLYVQSFPVTSTLETPKEKQDKKMYEADYPVLPAREERRILFEKILAKSHIIQTIQKDNVVLHQEAWKELNLLYGTASAPSHQVLSRINQTITTTGECVLATLLATPTNSITELNNRQEILQVLLHDPAQLQSIRDMLSTYKSAEQGMLSFYSEQDPLYEANTYDRMLKDAFYWGGIVKALKPWNKSVGALEFHKRFFYDFPLMTTCLTTGIMVGASVYVWLPSVAPQVPLYYRILLPPASIFYTWVSREYYKLYSVPIKYVVRRLADFRDFLMTSIAINELVKSCPELESVYASKLVYIRQLLNEPSHTELGKIVAILKDMPLHNWSLFINNTGRVLRTYELLQAHKEELADAIYELGQFDAFAGIAHMLQKQTTNSANHYTFAKLLDRSHQKKPYIQLRAMWNPLLDAERAITNDLSMNGASGGIRNIILTGPNAGGKSTFLTGVTISLVLSQTLGIAPVESITMTPFDKINTYLNIADDIVADKSLFMAELERAQKHINILKALKEDEFSFSIFDELFSGTNPREGEAAAYSIMNYMGRYDNALNILATHFPKIMLLEDKEKDKGFANYQVYITRESPEKKINFTYKVIPGKSNQTIAIELLEEKGYDMSILKDAREIIEHPERYQANF
jgi:tetratricopeptide (TPR) repeat protein